MSQTTAPEDTVTLIGIDGFEDTMLRIDDMSLEDYFADSGVAAPAEDEMTIMNGMPIEMTDKVPAGATIMVGKMVKNG